MTAPRYPRSARAAASVFIVMTLDDRRRQDERCLLAAAQAGDERAFGSLTGIHRGGLELYCLLMLGCPEKAHAVVVEALLRGWRGRGAVAASTSTLIWLYRLATDLCLESLERTDEFQRSSSLTSAWR